jgi:hypothetical protein
VDTEFHYVNASMPGFVDRRAKVWLECNGEPYDHRSVHVLATGQLAHEIPLVRFVCPRCGRQHQSLIFR